MPHVPLATYAVSFVSFLHTILLPPPQPSIFRMHENLLKAHLLQEYSAIPFAHRLFQQTNEQSENGVARW